MFPTKRVCPGKISPQFYSHFWLKTDTPTLQKYDPKIRFWEIPNKIIICYTEDINWYGRFFFCRKRRETCMLTKFFMQNTERPPTPKEGDLYKEITVCDKTFKLLYGYYESFERESPFNDPMPIYPDFIKQPQYTANGLPIVTAMQNTCAFFSGKTDEDSSCSDCGFFQQHEELFGLCNCPHNKRCHKERAGAENE